MGFIFAPNFRNILLTPILFIMNSISVANRVYTNINVIIRLAHNWKKILP